MITKKDVLLLGADLGAEITDERILGIDEQRVEAVAPEGMLWEDSDSITLIERYSTFYKGHKMEAWEFLHVRMSEGLRLMSREEKEEHMCLAE